MSLLKDGFWPVPPGKIIRVHTTLLMVKRPALRPGEGEPPAVAERLERPDLTWYRKVFQLVGEDHLWYSRLQMDDAQLAARLQHPDVHVFDFRSGDYSLGFFELQDKERKTCAIELLGLVPNALGRGLGRHLLEAALAAAWRPQIERVLVQTCALDHPAALPLYRSAGFEVVSQGVEVIDDPRLRGFLPLEAAPQVPIFGQPAPAAPAAARPVQRRA